jgi:hypothetical protein
MLHSAYEIVPMTLCIESDRVIILKNWCDKLGNCARDPATEIDLRVELFGFYKKGNPQIMGCQKLARLLKGFLWGIISSLKKNWPMY